MPTNYNRVTQAIFASSAGLNAIEEFGSKAAGSPVYTTDPADIQTTRYLQGWLGATLAGERLLPVYQDMNAIHFLFSWQLGYLLQKGIPEYDSATTYYTTDIVRQSGTTNLYTSAVNNNTGNSLSDNTKWTLLGNLANIPASTPLLAANNLSDLVSASTARTNLGLGTAATKNMTDWVSYTPTVSNLGAGSGTATGFWRIVGDTLEVQIFFVKDATPGSGASTVSFSLPSGKTIDVSKIPGTLGNSTSFGTAISNGLEDTPNFYASTGVTYVSTSAVAVSRNGAAPTFTGADFRANSTASLKFSVPIS